MLSDPPDPLPAVDPLKVIFPPSIVAELAEEVTESINCINVAVVAEFVTIYEPTLPIRLSTFKLTCAT